MVTPGIQEPCEVAGCLVVGGQLHHGQPTSEVNSITDLLRKRGYCSGMNPQSNHDCS